MIENILYIVTIIYNNYLNLSIVEELLILKCHCQRKKGSPIMSLNFSFPLTVIDSSYREIIVLLCSFLYHCYLRRPAGEGRGVILPHFCITARVAFKTRSLIRLKIRRHSCCFCFSFLLLFLKQFHCFFSFSRLNLLRIEFLALRDQP